MLKRCEFGLEATIVGALLCSALACSSDDNPNQAPMTQGPVGATGSVASSAASNTAGLAITSSTTGAPGTSTGAPSTPPVTSSTTTESASTAVVSTGTPSTATSTPMNTASASVTDGPPPPASSSTGAGGMGQPAGTGGSGPMLPVAMGGSGGAAAMPGDPPVSDIEGAGMSAGKCTLGAGVHEQQGQTQMQYQGEDVKRDGLNYRMITNGWGMGWRSHDISWLGTSLSINTYDGSRQDNGAPAGYPSVFCGRYSETSLDCGLPKALSGVTALNTAVSWSHPMADGTYNVAYDVWLGDGMGGGFRSLQSYFMVWLKDPAGEGPAGSLQEEGVTVPNAPGVWNIVAGSVNGLPIVNYVRAEGDELHAMAFDIMDFIRDAQMRNLEFPGNDLLAIAIGFEIWSGPVTGLKLNDFCLDIQ